jgi:mannose-1-phosphate guanylyltransferase/mannose-1-phosphate guanylyltransferase/mannose-6-phosphate isomerase
MIPVVISGGSGTRLWPISRAQFPKQFCQLFEEPLQSMTIQRCAKLGKPWVLTSAALKTLTENNLKDLGLGHGQVLYEPEGRNTGPAVAVLCHYLDLLGLKNEVMGIFPSDHLIRNQDVFLSAVKFAEQLAAKGRVVTLGITPTYPETGYGYIQSGQVLGSEKDLKAFSVMKFHEKPDLKKAESFLQQGGFSWNAGIFVFKVETMIEHFKKFQPPLWKTVEALNKDLSNIAEVYKKLPSISLDYAIMEHLGANELACIPSEMGWNDVGSWDAVAAEYGDRQSHQANVVSENSQNTFVYSQREKTVALLDVEDLLVVDTEDGLLIAKKGSSQNVKKVVDELMKKQSSVVKTHLFEDRPWGRFEILRDTPEFKSKVISIRPMSQISYQSHAKREEHWIVTQGEGEVILNDKTIPVKKGTYIHIPLGAKHRIKNTTQQDLQFVEVQLGSYFGEDDIVRYQDDYKRL